jgi:endoglucanase
MSSWPKAVRTGLTGLAACLLAGLAAADPADFVRRSGDRLVVGPEARPVELRGVCFGNEVWSNTPVAPVNHHGEVDYARVREMGMNAVRFYLNYGLFESDVQPYVYKHGGWDWLDQNVRWAAQHGVYLILNMHVPQGGFQSLGDGLALWNVEENRLRLRALWREIAYRYRNEPIIAGYDLLNEPIVSVSIEQWQQLASELVADIRSVDPHHLIVVERLNGVSGDWRTYGQPNLFLVDDPNVMYQVHFYAPIEYTHQNASWTGLPPDGSYPDPNALEVPSDIGWHSTSYTNPHLPAGDSGWAWYEGVPSRADDPAIISAKPVVASDLNAGTTWFDEMVVEEYDTAGRFVREVLRHDPASTEGWGFWSQNGAGSLTLSTSDGRSDGASLAITGTSSAANAYNNALRFPVTTGHSYRISGWLKGGGVAPEANALLRVDFESSPSGAPLHRRDRQFLASVLAPYIAFRVQHQVPLFVGEFGLYRECWDKGGLSWVSDLLDLFEANGLHFTYHAYHEGAFGIYPNPGPPDPAQANLPLIRLFQQKLQ